jgi:hypothetical protein
MIVVAGLTACDSNDAPPTPEFEAEMTGDVEQTLNGTAGMSDSDAFDQQFQGAFRLLPTLLPDSTRPDSLPLPDSINTPPATLLILTAESGNGYGQTITATFYGDSIPETGTYEVGLVLDTARTTPFPELDVTAGYIDSQPDSLLIAGAMGGTITLEESSQNVMRGRFQLETQQALRLTGLGTTGPLGPDNFGLRPFDTEIRGSFTALRSADAEPLLPFGGLVGL